MARGEARGFAHPIVRTVIYDDMTVRERQRRHAEAARYLHEHQAPVSQVAAQLFHDDNAAEPWALEALIDAARGARALGAPDAAADYLRLALRATNALPSRRTVLLELGEIEAVAGASEAADHLTEALELSETLSERAQSTLALARALNYAGLAPRAGELLRNAADEIDDQKLSEGIRIELLSSAHTSVGFRLAVADRLEALTVPPPGPLDELDRATLTTVGVRALTAANPMSEARDLLLRAVSDPPERWDPILHSMTYGLALVMLIYADELELATASWESILEGARARGSGLGVVLSNSALSLAGYRRGDLLRAGAHAHEALELADVPGVATGRRRVGGDRTRRQRS